MYVMSIKYIFKFLDEIFNYFILLIIGWKVVDKW